MRQSKRTRTMEQMRRGKFRLLVATDVAARGLDLKRLTHVINFDLPMMAEDYIHRIGRTGRCGETGIAVSLIGPSDWPKLAAIERFTKQTIKREVIEGLEPKKPEPRGKAKPKPSKRRRPKRFGNKRPEQFKLKPRAKKNKSRARRKTA